MSNNTLRRHIMGGGGKSSVSNQAGDIAYKTSSGKILTVSPDEWNSSLGTPVGVVVVPSGFAPDNGKARIISLNWASVAGTGSTSVSGIKWSNIKANTSLTDYYNIPITDNTSSGIWVSSLGYLPSDKFTGTTSYVDSTVKYYSATNSERIPSPYLGDKPNPAYYAEISEGNALSNFDGKGNTDVLVGLGSDYVAANAARNYKAAGGEEIEWYLPAAGELGYMIARFNKISLSLTAIGGSKLTSTMYFWSSVEYGYSNAYQVNMENGCVTSTSKTYAHGIRPFAQLDF